MVRRPRWQLALLAVLVPVAGLAVLDIGLRGLGLLPPDDPLLFFARTHDARFTPFVAQGHVLVIRPDWVNDGARLRGRRGKRAGRQFLLPGFRPARVTPAKAPGTLRVVALGGSTTYGLYVGADEAFPAVLGRRLEAALSRPVEVLNLGCAGFASDRTAALLDTALELGPDLVVVYSGHNEMLEGHVGAVSDLDPALRLRARLLAVSSLAAWTNHVVARSLRAVETEEMREEVAALEAGQIPTFVPEEVPEIDAARPTPRSARGSSNAMRPICAA